MSLRSEAQFPTCARLRSFGKTASTKWRMWGYLSGSLLAEDKLWPSVTLICPPLNVSSTAASLVFIMTSGKSFMTRMTWCLNWEQTDIKRRYTPSDSNDISIMQRFHHLLKLQQNKQETRTTHWETSTQSLLVICYFSHKPTDQLNLNHSSYLKCIQSLHGVKRRRTLPEKTRKTAEEDLTLRSRR